MNFIFKKILKMNIGFRFSQNKLSLFRTCCGLSGWCSFLQIVMKLAMIPALLDMLL
jgi:hypothetical protein